MNKVEKKFIQRRDSLIEGKDVEIESEDLILSFNIRCDKYAMIIINGSLEGKTELGKALESTLDGGTVEAICYATTQAHDFDQEISALEKEVEEYGEKNHNNKDWVWELEEREKREGFDETDKSLCFNFAKNHGFVDLTKNNNPGVSIHDDDGVVFKGGFLDAVLYSTKEDEVVGLEVFVNDPKIQNENTSCVGQWLGEKAKKVIQDISHMDCVIGEILKCPDHARLEIMIDKHFEALEADSIGY